MFIGHYAPALIAATLPRAPRLGTLFVAAQLVDIGFFALVLADVEHLRVEPGITAMNPLDLYHMPWTHSLIGTLAWAAGFALIVGRVARDRAAGLIAGAVVLSHWLLDLLVHAPDLTLWGAPPRLGLGLWNHPAIAIPLELGLTLGALLWYAHRTAALSLGGKRLLVALAAVLLAVQLLNWFGPPPAEVAVALPLTALAAYLLFAALAWGVARNRTRKP
ncbi:hypothetical protein [Sphingosinithalassobacter sp. CS137]|uniref:hypothetical protein n=1 Tax=Sphingosinithalassobacter sp. CS137 TaxID=2762748 RepID=UPI00165EB2BE|nr:hypothetical protein [Sphingosinithalassobacter sp. CS137]